MSYSDLGLIGTGFYMFCSLIQLVQTIKRGNTNHMYDIYILAWLMGNIFTIVYVALVVPKLPLLINYSINSLSLAIIIYYRFKPRRVK